MSPNLNFVHSDEDIDRSIRVEKEYFALRDNGKVFVTANAFRDRMQQPSFFRRCLTDNPPFSNPPRFSSPERKYPDAVVTLRAGAIRAQTNPFIADSGEGKDKITVEYSIDIKPDLSNNQHKAHAIVYASPQYKSNSAFQKIKEKLARLANERIDKDGWPIAPDPHFVENELLG